MGNGANHPLYSILESLGSVRGTNGIRTPKTKELIDPWIRMISDIWGHWLTFSTTAFEANVNH